MPFLVQDAEGRPMSVPTSGYGPGGTDVPVTDGGTGASTAAGARTNLGAAPSDAKYVVLQATTGLSAEASLGAMTSGILKFTSADGVAVLETASAGTDYASGTDARFTSQLVNMARTDDATLVALDAGKVVTMNKAEACTLTIPKQSVIALPLGCFIDVYQIGAGQVTVAAVDGDVTLRAPNGAKLKGQYAHARLWQLALDEWILSGDTAV